MSSSKQLLSSIFACGLNAVSPDKLVCKTLKKNGEFLTLGKKVHHLRGNVYVVGFGKAVSGMCRGVQNVIGNNITRGILIVPHGLSCDLKKSGKEYLLPVNDGRIELYEAARHNLPDKLACEATKLITSICRAAGKDDLVIALVSGGGSALLTAPTPPLTVNEKRRVTEVLAACGASIDELNTVRRSISLVKGGKLALLAHPAKVWGLILSDIIDDPMPLIASGPTVVDSSHENNPFEVMKIIDKYHAKSLLSPAFYTALQRSADNDCLPVMDTDAIFNILIGNNHIAVEAAMSEARRRKFHTVLLGKNLSGNACDIGVLFIQIALYIINSLSSGHAPSPAARLQLSAMLPATVDITSFLSALDAAVMSFAVHGGAGVCVTAAGETTTKLCKNPGLGGRNQEMVLAGVQHYMNALSNASVATQFDVSFLSAGTDGLDGPTPAAGAVFSSSGVADFNLDEVETCLASNNSYEFFRRHGDGLIMTGATGTNVMDIQLLTVSLYCGI